MYYVFLRNITYTFIKPILQHNESLQFSPTHLVLDILSNFQANSKIANLDQNQLKVSKQRIYMYQKM